MIWILSKKLSKKKCHCCPYPAENADGQKRSRSECDRSSTVLLEEPFESPRMALGLRPLQIPSPAIDRLVLQDNVNSVGDMLGLLLIEGSVCHPLSRLTRIAKQFVADPLNRFSLIATFSRHIRLF